jgi:hypothetical protein
VTQTLEDVGISDWSGVPSDILWDAQQRGTMVHRACHFINQRNLDPSTVDERIAGYVEAWKAFRRDHEFQVRLSEHLVYQRIQINGRDAIVESPTDLEILGQLDVEGQMKKQGQVVADLKTGEETGSWRPQTAAYVRGLGRTFQYTHKRLIVQLKRTGNYKLIWYPLRDFDADWEVFRLALIEGKRKELEAA